MSRFSSRIPDAVDREVRLRDNNRCVGPTVGMPGACIGYVQRDHIRASGALGLKSRSTTDNVCLLCALHHEMKTNNGKKWRPVLIEYVDRMEAARVAAS